MTDASGPPPEHGPIAVVGAGYVGLPLAVAFAEKGHPVTVHDEDEGRVKAVAAGRSYLSDVASERLARQVEAGRLGATADAGALAGADAVLICVPTPLDRHREPDTTAVERAAEAVASHLPDGQLVSLESTTYPGTTEELVLPALAVTGRTVGEDFFLVYSPERLDPGNARYDVTNTPKVVGGVTEACLLRGVSLYRRIAPEVVPVSSTRVAEASKLLENIYRNVNIALVNELKMLFDRMDIDIWEVIEAAKTKPFGYHPFYPGPGVGGHCIPVDPFYLTWKGREYDFPTRFIELAGQINTAMPEYVFGRIAEALNDHGKPLRGARVLLLGVAYKPDVDDTRGSPALKLIRLLDGAGAEVAFHDPQVPRISVDEALVLDRAGGPTLSPEELEGADAVVVVTDHTAYDWEMVLENSRLVVDTRNAVKGDPDRVYRA